MRMDIDRERLALRHLEEALAWPPDEREKRLLQTLQHDPGLLTDVRELLRSAEAVNESLPTSLPVAPVEDNTPPPERIGPYRLGDLLGSGGMGRVYRAERADGAFERTVAIKLMRRTRLPALVEAQFARERQILARLQHRNIAQLLDGGVTEDGQSYFVMELVAGRPISQYALEQNLSLVETLRLFTQVCTAVQFAHARLVVHADIKPNNVIVSDEGGVKLLDFGVARVLDADAPPIGLTLSHASPARQRGESPTTLDDVYSLGVLLDELLARFAPLPADLRAIAECARAQDPAHRYATVEALHDDIRRWITKFPVRAHRGNWRYSAGKFLSRHRVAVSTSVVAVVFLAAGIVALAMLYTRAEHARAQAETRFNDLRELSRFVLFDVYDRLETIPRALAIRGDLAAAGQRYLDRLAKDPNAPPEVRLDVAEGLRRIAQIQARPGWPSLSNAAMARQNLDHAEALAKTLPDSGDHQGQRALALSRIALARARLSMWTDSDFKAAGQSLETANALLGANPTEHDARSLKTDIAIERAYALQWQGEYAKSIAVIREALPQFVPQDEKTPEARRTAMLRRASLLDILADNTYYSGDATAAEQPYREELALLRQIETETPYDINATRRVQRAEWALGSLLTELNRPAEGAEILAHSVASMEQLQLLEPDDKDLKRLASVTANAYGDALVALKRYDEAFPIYERSLTMRRKRWDDTPTDWGAARDYAMALATMGDARSAAKQNKQACAAYSETLGIFDKIRGAGRLTKLDEDNAVRIVKEHHTSLCR